MPIAISDRLPRYVEREPMVPVWCLTPGEGRATHRYFDTSPISPSGRFVALTRFPADDRMPEPGDEAEVFLVDLSSGEEVHIARTRGWDVQLGAQAQWGTDDSQLYFADMDVERWRPYSVRYDPATSERVELDGFIYEVSPDGSMGAGPCPLRNRRTQAGYGVVVPPEVIPENRGAPDDDGVYVTDTRTGASRLLISLREVVETIEPPLDLESYGEGAFYAAHVKFSPRGERLMLVMRWLPYGWDGRDKSLMRRHIVTMGVDGSEVRLALAPEVWARGGHHPVWNPDGEHIVMNLKLDGEHTRLVSFRRDGTELRALSDTLEGTGHPAMHPDGRHVLADVPVGSSAMLPDEDTALVRLMDLATGEDLHLVGIEARPPYLGEKSAMRVDPHPAWGPDFTRIVFNACPGGARRVYLADLGGVL